MLGFSCISDPFTSSLESCLDVVTSLNIFYFIFSRHTLVHHGVAPRRALGLLPDRGRLALRLATGRRKAVKSTGLSFQPGSAPFTFTGICLLLEYTFIRADGRQRNMGGEFWKEKLLSSTWS